MRESHPRLLNQIFENPEFQIDEASLGYLVRDIINMNWWNTSGILKGYKNNRRISGDFTETQKRIAVQLKEFYRYRIIALKNENKFRDEIRGYINGNCTTLRQLNAYSMLSRANPSQYFLRRDGSMTWVDCTSRATYAAKYVFQNGYIDFDGKCRVLGVNAIISAIQSGGIEDLGISEWFHEGNNQVKAECFSQKETQKRVDEWVSDLNISILPNRQWLFEAVKHVRTDPYKKYESEMIRINRAPGVNECLYGFKTMASHASDASHASHASHASDASHASHASRASDAGATAFYGSSWALCKMAIMKPDHLNYPPVFRANIFAIAGNWKINKDVAGLAKLGWFDPFSGHGTSPLYAKRYGIRYLGFDTNQKAFTEYLDIVNEECRMSAGSSVEIRCQDSTVFDPSLICQFDLCYTSPPYFNFEEYGGNTGHFEGCKSYDEFHEKITIPVFRNVHSYLISGGTLALQLEKNKPLVKKWEKVISWIGFRIVSSGITGHEANKYSTMSKRDQSLLIFDKI